MFPVGLDNFGVLFSGYYIIFYFGISIANAVFLYFSSGKSLLSLQQSGYKNKRYLKWLVHPDTPYLSRLMLLCLLGFLFFCLLSVCFSAVAFPVGGAYVGFASYVLFTGMYINSERTVNAKVPLNKTHRLKRLSVTFGILLFAATFGLLVLSDLIAYASGSEIVGMVRYSLICVLPILCPYILLLANSINYPSERAITKKYVKRTTEKLDRSNVIKIGVTGSFGKTSVKEILKTVLSQKYRVLATDGSYNTPVGIALSVKKLDSTHDVFIAEMGARNKGDIKELSEIVKPSIALLTGINSQHLESFKTIENTMSTKFELIESLGKNGTAFFSSDNEGAVELYKKANCEKYLAGINKENAEVYAENIKTSERGTEFTLAFSSGEKIDCVTTLLGRHSVSNVCLAAAAARRIGLSPEEIRDGIARVTSVGHRLELVPNNKNIVIIDDSYNSNEDGARSAMEVLDGFNGRKIVLTPGLVELGKRENVANYEFGKTLSSHADKVVVIGRHNAEMLIKGLLDGGMKKEDVSFAKTLNKGNELLNAMLKEGDVVLFENDLPDNYS